MLCFFLLWIVLNDVHNGCIDQSYVETQSHLLSLYLPDMVLLVYSKGRSTKVKFIRNQKDLAVEKGPFPAYANYKGPFANSIPTYLPTYLPNHPPTHISLSVCVCLSIHNTNRNNLTVLF